MWQFQHIFIGLNLLYKLIFSCVICKMGSFMNIFNPEIFRHLKLFEPLSLSCLLSIFTKALIFEDVKLMLYKVVLTASLVSLRF